jgi:predicted DNA-binding transcriptional regulator AlpA
MRDGEAGSVLVKCHAGCDSRDVIAALRTRGLWPDGRDSERSFAPPRPAASNARIKMDDFTSDRFLREPERQRITGLSRMTWWRMEREGRVPKRRKISDNGVGWLASEIAAWVAARKQKVA